MRLTPEKKEKMAKEFAEVINRNSGENESNTPDFIAGEFLVNCFESYNEACRQRDNWYGGKQSISDSEKGKKW